MLNYILVGLGSAAGGISRFWASGIIANRYGQSFPWGTLFVMQTLSLAQDEEWLYACGNTVFNLVLCLVAVWLGHILAEALNPTKGI